MERIRENTYSVYKLYISISVSLTKHYLCVISQQWDHQKMYEACSNLLIETLEQRQWGRSGDFIVKSEQISHIVLFPVLTLNKQMLNGYVEICQFLKMHFQAKMTELNWTWHSFNLLR